MRPNGVEGDFDIPGGVLLPVDRVEVRLDERRHPYELEHADAIESHWKEEFRRNPALFDGEVIMLASLYFQGATVTGTCHPIRFATFLHWRAHAFAGKAFHIFANAVPVTSDGALIAVRMAPHTANCGRVYFAAGNFERTDFRNGLADPAANMRREVAEETGIDLGPLRHDEQYHILRSAIGLTLVRRYYLNEDAETVMARVRKHFETDPEPEIDDVMAIGSEKDVPESAPAHMVPLVHWHFSSPPGRRGNP